MTIVRPSRRLAAEKKACPICLENFFTPTAERGKVTPVKMPCTHTFCRDCIERHLSSSIACPLPWCTANLSVQPATCTLCAAWQRDHAATGSLVVTVRAKEMLGGIKDALAQLAHEDPFYALPKTAKSRLLAHVRTTLKRYEWQFHCGIDLAELLDPFLLAVNADAARDYYGTRLSSPAPDPTHFPPRNHDLDDYPAGQEPWIAAFFRQWALDYEGENGEVKHGWGVWEKKAEQDGWEWPYKRIMAHKTGAEGHLEYLVKWVGQRYFASWVQAAQLDDEARRMYDETHGVSQVDEGSLKRWKK